MHTLQKPPSMHVTCITAISTCTSVQSRFTARASKQWRWERLCAHKSVIHNKHTLAQVTVVGAHTYMQI